MELKKIKKLKRKLSIITVFIWIFLIVTMATIVIGNINKTRALEEENVEDSNELVIKRYVDVKINMIFVGINDCDKIPKDFYLEKIIINTGVSERLLLKDAIIEKDEKGNVALTYEFKVPIYVDQKWTFFTIQPFNYEINGYRSKTIGYEWNKPYEDKCVNVSYGQTYWLQREYYELSSAKGSCQVLHEYYKKDRDNRLILENICSNTIRDIDIDKKVGISSDIDKVDIEVGKKLFNVVEGIEYEYKYLGNSGNVIIDEKNTLKKITLKYVRDLIYEVNVKVEKKWEDDNNKAGKRPKSIVLQVKNKDIVVEEKEVSEENNWKYEFILPKYDEYGNEIDYIVDEKETNEFYEKIIDGNIIINRYINKVEDNKKNNEIENVDTSDINILRYVIVGMISMIGIVIGIFYIRKNNMYNKIN